MQPSPRTSPSGRRPSETIRRRLAENELKPWLKKMWCVPKVDGAYVARMEDVLDLYAEEPDERRPVVCFDETPRQLIGEARVPVSRYDSTHWHFESPAREVSR